jgi:endo-1,4-beta-xylanase
MKVFSAILILGMCVPTMGFAQSTLKDAFTNEFLIGAALNEAVFTEKNQTEVKIVKTQFNTISPEDVLKWESIHSQPGKYDFSLADRYVQFGVDNKMFIVGHNLVWHSQTPRWVFQNTNGTPVDRDTLLARMRDHIFTVVTRYKGKIGGWDVVNEALNEDGELRDSPWRKIIGDDYIAKAFEFAHEADPQAQLYYNDFSLEDLPKRNGAIALLKKLQSENVKIFGVGLQGHYRLDSPSATDVDETISAFSSLGLKVMITELDIDVLPSPGRLRGADVSQRLAGRAAFNPYTNGLPESVQQQLADRYASLFSVFLKHRSEINRVTFWGVADGDSWLNKWPVLNRVSYPLLFDRAGKSKPAFFAVMKAAQMKSEAKLSKEPSDSDR